MPYAVTLTRPAARELEALPPTENARIRAALWALAGNPRPPGCTKLSGSANRWRVRVGDYRIVYAIEDAELVILVLRVAHRREVYR